MAIIALMVAEASKSLRGDNVYQSEDLHMDYKIWNFMGLELRGPKPDLSKKHLCFLGAAQTFGRLCENPYPSLVCEKLGFECLNFGVGGVDPEFFLDAKLLRQINKAESVFVQVFSARSSQNSLFKSNYGRRHGICNGKQTLVDDFWQDCIKNMPSFDVYNLIQETRKSYLSNMISLSEQIKVKKTLLWFSYRSPDYATGLSDYFSAANDFPHFVDRNMINCLIPYFDEYIECSGKQGIPQVTPNFINTYYPSPQNHINISELIVNNIKRDMCSKKILT